MVGVFFVEIPIDTRDIDFEEELVADDNDVTWGGVRWDVFE